MPTHLPDGSTLAHGVATAAYQIEGATTEDGRGASIWETFAARPGATRDGLDGATAICPPNIIADTGSAVSGFPGPTGVDGVGRGRGLFVPSLNPRSNRAIQVSPPSFVFHAPPPAVAT